MTAGCPDCEVREIARMDVEMRERFFDRAEREAGRDARRFLQTRVWDEADRIAALRNPHRVLRADRGLDD